jgi:hypothetical protein
MKELTFSMKMLTHEEKNRATMAPNNISTRATRITTPVTKSRQRCTQNLDSLDFINEIKMFSLA